MQRVSAVLPAAALAAILPLASCGPGSNRPPASNTAPPANSTAPVSSANPSGGAAAFEPLAPDYPNPSKLLVDDYSSEGLPEGSSARPGKSGLTVTVQESGPELPWTVRVVNSGDMPVEFVADTRLLWFEVVAPGKKKSTTCKLPDKLGPQEGEPRLRVLLMPGEGVMDAFDPRLYCFAEGDQRLLVPGAQIVPHFGFAEANAKKRWQNGKLVEEAAVSRPPFVAMGKPPHDAAHESPSVSTESESAKATPTPKGKPGKKHKDAKAKQEAEEAKARAVAAVSDKELVGNRFALRSEYSAWSRRTDNPKKDDNGPEPDLRLYLIQGSDARAEHDATVQLSLENQSSAPTHVFFRREMVTFEVTGPKGVTLCRSVPNAREPDRQSFLKIESHRKRTFTSRLAELCPLGTFATPGLYLVHARFDAIHNGEGHGLHAFVGAVLSDAPATVRIRVGEAPILHKHMSPLAPHQSDRSAPQNPPVAAPTQPATAPQLPTVAPEKSAPASTAPSAPITPSTAPVQPSATPTQSSAPPSNLSPEAPSTEGSGMKSGQP